MKMEINIYKYLKHNCCPFDVLMKLLDEIEMIHVLLFAETYLLTLGCHTKSALG